MTKIRKKLTYWINIHLSLAGRITIANSVLLSTLWFFICIWGGSLHAIRKIRAMIRDFLWSGTTNRSRARISWTDCCASRLVGGLNLVDPEEALHALAVKWILKAMLPGGSNLQFLLRYRFLQIRPQACGGWPEMAQWTFLRKFKAARGFRAWDRILRAWRLLVKHISATPPRNRDEILTSPIWWIVHFLGGPHGFSLARAAQLMAKGMWQFQHIYMERVAGHVPQLGSGARKIRLIAL